MPRNALVWGTLVLLYLAFFAWYTSFDGPLSDEEIERFVALMQERGRTPEEIADLRAFLESDTGDDFAMVNVIELRESPLRVAGVGPEESASDVLDRYLEYMWPALLVRACHPVLAGRAAAAALDVWGIEGARRWSQAGVMRYRSRRDLLEIAGNPEFGGRHEFKQAAMLKTVAFPIDPWFELGDPRLLLALLFGVVGLAASRPARR